MSKNSYKPSDFTYFVTELCEHEHRGPTEASPQMTQKRFHTRTGMKCEQVEVAHNMEGCQAIFGV